MFDLIFPGRGEKFLRLRASFLLIIMSIIIYVLPPIAQAAYVTDDFNIALRSEALKDAAVVAWPKNGTPLEVLEEREDWLRVKTDDGKEGWVTKRYVSEETPQRLRIESLEKKLNEASIKLKITSEKAAAVEEENKSLKKDLASSQEKLKKVEGDFTVLQADSGNVLELKKNYEESASNLSKAMASMERLQAENNELRSRSELRWFLAGAGIIAAGWLVGFVMGKMNRGKRHSSYLG